jgi:monoamine oxidase
VDPGHPWSHPEASRLDRASVAGWLRSVDALPTTVRAVEAGALALAAGSSERTSLLSELRKAAAVGDTGFYSYDLWESRQVSEGSAEVAIRMAAELEGRIRFGAEAASIAVSPQGSRVTLSSGETIAAEAVVCALPVSVLHGVSIDGVAPARVASLRAQRHALAAKVVTVYDHAVWTDVGANGLSEGEQLLASTWPQRPGVLSGLVPPERIAWLLATAEEHRAGVLVAELERMYGLEAGRPRHTFLRLWAIDPHTLGYTTHWWPGDVLRVGPLHGTHEPPFYVCGSDQWVAGYMEGAVRTGRAAAAAALGSREELPWAPAR